MPGAMGVGGTCVTSVMRPPHRAHFEYFTTPHSSVEGNVEVVLRALCCLLDFAKNLSLKPAGLSARRPFRRSGPVDLQQAVDLAVAQRAAQEQVAGDALTMMVERALDETANVVDVQTTAVQIAGSNFQIDCVTARALEVHALGNPASQRAGDGTESAIGLADQHSGVVAMVA
jgi:hypothetical protein